MESLVFGLLLIAIFPSGAFCMGYCAAHCDVDGYYRDSFRCRSSTSRYCCGDLNTRRCCNNATADISNKYQDVYSCDRSSWWIYHWQVIIGMLASIIVILLFAACCCQCCSFCKRTNNSGTSATTNTPNHTGTSSDNSTTNSNARDGNNFDPESPNAFQPPPYESLEKEPPKYEELYMMSEFGQSNPGYVSDIAQAGPSSSANPSGSPETIETTGLPGFTGRNSARSTTSHGSDVSDSLPSYDIAISRDRIQPDEHIRSENVAIIACPPPAPQSSGAVVGIHTAQM